MDGPQTRQSSDFLEKLCVAYMKLFAANRVQEHTDVDSPRAIEAEYLCKRLESSERLVDELGLPDAYATKLFDKDNALLEFGCGRGDRLIKLIEESSLRKVYGVDIIAERIDDAWKLAASTGLTERCDFRHYDGSHIPWESNTFDTVICFGVMEHLPQPHVNLSEIMRVLKPGGSLLFAFPSFRSLASHHLNYVTYAPGVHLMFPARVVAAAYSELLRTYYPQAYPRDFHFNLDAWEKSPTMNGLTYRAVLDIFKRLAPSRCDVWQTPLFENRAFVLNRRAARIRSALSVLTRSLVRVPFVGEYFSHQVVGVVTK